MRLGLRCGELTLLLAYLVNFIIQVFYLKERGSSGLEGHIGMARVTNLGDALIRHTKIRWESIALSTM